jgi:hypothetical protein
MRRLLALAPFPSPSLLALASSDMAAPALAYQLEG